MRVGDQFWLVASCWIIHKIWLRLWWLIVRLYDGGRESVRTDEARGANKPHDVLRVCDLSGRPIVSPHCPALLMTTEPGQDVIGVYMRFIYAGG